MILKCDVKIQGSRKYLLARIFGKKKKSNVNAKLFANLAKMSKNADFFSVYRISEKQIAFDIYKQP